MMVKVRCSYCNEEAEIKYGVSSYFCPYCGKTMNLLDESNNSNANVSFNINVDHITTRNIDDARIKEADVHENIEIEKINREWKIVLLKKLPIIIAILAWLIWQLTTVSKIFD